MFVYLFECQSEEGTVYKIGFTSTSYKDRMKACQTGNPEELKFVTEYKSQFARKMETSLHNHFKYCHKNGEFFKLDLIDVVNFKKICEKLEKNFSFLTEHNYFWK